MITLQYRQSFSINDLVGWSVLLSIALKLARLHCCKVAVCCEMSESLPVVTMFVLARCDWHFLLCYCLFYLGAG